MLSTITELNPSVPLYNKVTVSKNLFVLPPLSTIFYNLFFRICAGLKACWTVWRESDWKFFVHLWKLHNFSYSIHKLSCWVNFIHKFFVGWRGDFFPRVISSNFFLSVLLRTAGCHGVGKINVRKSVCHFSAWVGRKLFGL